jgi:NADPH:quinone reductase-like Zn-dependent oxidoreductase
MASVNPPTAYYLLTKYVSLQTEDWIIQNCANSAVGRYVITFAKKMGIKTINLVRRDSAVQELKDFGGDIVLVDAPDIAKQVSKLVDIKKVKIAFDGVAGDATHRLSQCLAFGGTIVNYGAMSMNKCELGASATIFKQITLKGIWLQKWTETAPKEEVEKMYKITNKAVISGEVYTAVDSVYPLEDIKKAVVHAMKEERKGKILITGPAYKK